MSKVVNLGRVRKDKERAARRRQADANSARFGETKADRQARQTREVRAREQLDGHRRDRDGSDQ
ncbi:DUF4169 family protein [Palleronia caenipelagi]|uniref:DUF4169 family protein n=1 Tax=Palleronia caenipelagi TaxID=2489174 RepID=A0A547PNJ6_9RHOB|nr:DUF4169 family protein [Palleronia caenipelagi]TRD15700.1 DUF4169 family protein [Palleronia caenipelagi]